MIKKKIGCSEYQIITTSLLLISSKSSLGCLLRFLKEGWRIHDFKARIKFYAVHVGAPVGSYAEWLLSQLFCKLITVSVCKTLDYVFCFGSRACIILCNLRIREHLAEQWSSVISNRDSQIMLNYELTE